VVVPIGCVLLRFPRSGLQKFTSLFSTQINCLLQIGSTSSVAVWAFVRRFGATGVLIPWSWQYPQ